jgi:hypothetical protein
MQVVHTPGDAPNHGRMNLPISGWTWNSRNALRNTAAQNSNIVTPRSPAAGTADGGASGSGIAACGAVRVSVCAVSVTSAPRTSC